MGKKLTLEEFIRRSQEIHKEEMSIIRLYKEHKTKDTPLKGGNGEVFDIDVLKLDLETLNLRGESGCCN